MNEPHKPIKYINITMHTDINVIDVLRIRQVLLEVLHISYEQVSVTFKILVSLLNSHHTHESLSCYSQLYYKNDCYSLWQHY